MIKPIGKPLCLVNLSYASGILMSVEDANTIIEVLNRSKLYVPDYSNQSAELSDIEDNFLTYRFVDKEEIDMIRMNKIMGL